jgi:hypothetical protein
VRYLSCFLLLFLPSLISAQEIQVWSGIEYSTVAEINERFQEETGNTLAIREFDVALSCCSLNKPGLQYLM